MVWIDVVSTVVHTANVASNLVPATGDLAAAKRLLDNQFNPLRITPSLSKPNNCYRATSVVNDAGTVQITVERTTIVRQIDFEWFTCDLGVS